MEIDCAVASARFSDPKLDAIRLHRENYALVGARALLTTKPLKRPDDAREHVLLDISAELPLFRYFQDAPRAGEPLRWGRIVRLGTVAAIRARVAAGAGVAVLPEYLIRTELEKGTFQRCLPKIELLHDWFRLIFRADDPRRTVYERIAARLLEVPLR
jgi:DNA-binding transcriptional LysR family regulator